MTSNELKDYVDAAIKQRDSLTLLWFILVPVISILGSFLTAYLTEKGKNTATKEDVGRITREIESSKAHFSERLEHVRADLSSRTHYGKVRYERELKVFEEVWPKLCDLREAVLSLRPVMDSLPGPERQRSRARRTGCQRVAETYKALDKTVQHSRPFYPLPTIWEELRKLLDMCYAEFFHFGSSDMKDGFKDYWEKAMANSRAINEQVDRTCEAIRSRLTDFAAQPKVPRFQIPGWPMGKACRIFGEHRSLFSPRTESQKSYFAE